MGFRGIRAGKSGPQSAGQAMEIKMSDVGGRRARGGGGSARRAERTAVSFETAKFIQRNIPNFEILNEEALEIIEWNAETVLEEIGVNFVENPEALKRWKTLLALLPADAPIRAMLEERIKAGSAESTDAQLRLNGAGSIKEQQVRRPAAFAADRRRRIRGRMRLAAAARQRC